MCSVTSPKSLFAFTVLAIAAVSGTAKAQTLPQYDVRNYGAACNGTTDDSGAFQSALNAVPSSGGTVLISCKMGIGSAVQLANKSNVTVRGSVTGAGIRSLAATSQGVQGFSPVLFAVLNCSSCTISGLDFDGNNVGVIPLGLDRSNNTIVQNNTIHDVAPVSGGALVSTGGTSNQYINNTITNTANDYSSAVRGIWIGNAGSTQAETSPYIANNTLRNIGASAIVAHAYTPTILNNNIDTVSGAGIKIVPPDGAVGVQRIEGNTTKNTTFHGLQVDDNTSKVINSVLIKNNWFESATHTGMYLASTLVNSNITGNTVVNNHESGASGWEGGILVYGANGLTIQNNRIYDTNGASSPRQDIGIQINAQAGNVQNVQITNNYINNNSMYGVVVQDNGGYVNGVTFSGSAVTSNSQQGIHIQENTANAVNNIAYSSGCFAANAYATIYDNRGSRALSAPPSSYSCVDPTSTTSTIADTSAPSVAITAPSAGQSVSGTVTLSASAADNVGVVGVQFKVDGVNVGSEATAAPYSASWNAGSVSAGSHNITAVARDAAGNTTTSAAITVQVGTVGSTTTGSNTVTINAYGSPSGGVYPHMELRLGTTLLSSWDVTGTAQNYTFSSSTALNTANLRVYFTNDMYDAVSDRNLFVNSLKLNSTTFLSNASNVYASSCTSGYLQTTVLYCNGYFEYPTQAVSVSASNSVTVNAYGSPTAGIYPHMELRMGTSLLTAWDVTSIAQNYIYTTSSPVNTAKLRVYFTNDAYDATSDRNLFVNSLQLNGTTYLTNSPNVYSAACTSGYLQSIALYCNGYLEYPTI